MIKSLFSKTRRSVGALLLIIAVTPILALTILVGQQLAQVSSVQNDLAALEANSNEVAELIRLDQALSSEIYWTEGVIAVEDFGLQPAMVTLFLGTDLEANLLQAQEAVDLALADIDNPALDQQVDDARADDSARSALELSALAVFAADLRSTQIEAGSDALLDRSTQLASSAQVAQKAQDLVTANGLRSAFDGIIGAYFALEVYGSADNFRSVLATNEFRYAYLEHLGELNRHINPRTQTGSALDEIQSGTSTVAVLSNSLAAIEGFQVTTAEPSASVGGPSISPSAFETLATSFAAAVDASALHLTLVDAAESELNDAVRAAQADGKRRMAALGFAAAAVLLGTAMSAVLVTRSIVSPLRKLGSASEALQQGGELEMIEVSGPREVRVATETLNLAVLELMRAEAQANALTDGRLEQSLIHGPSGALGRSLNAAVARLSESIAEGEGLRTMLAHEATHDSLTGLPNRKATMQHLTDVLAQSEGSDKPFCVLYIDLDGFKAVNDMHGHAAGDELLVQIAKRMRQTSRSCDFVGRIGGDEFLIVTEPLRSASDAWNRAERLRKDVLLPLTANGNSLDLTVSVGVRVVSDRDSAPDTLIREADYAVYASKAAGRNQVVVFDDHLRSQLLSEAGLEEAIRSGLTRDEFRLEFQPIIDPVTGQPIELEALLRWTRPGYGNVPPDEFIPFAERSDLIVDIDRWVINAGIQHLVDFQRDPDLAGIRVALNMSGRHFFRSDLYRDVVDVLDAHSADPSLLSLEITESALLHDLAATADVLDRLRHLGVTIAIDDFGTGYTSLSHLRVLPADVLKIDRSFTQRLSNPDDLSLVRLVIETGHLLGMRITAEGVETEEQRVTLVALGIDAIQGWLIAPSLPPADIASALLAHQTGGPVSITR